MAGPRKIWIPVVAVLRELQEEFGCEDAPRWRNLPSIISTLCRNVTVADIFQSLSPPALFKSATDYAGPMHQRRKNFQECENGPLER